MAMAGAAGPSVGDGPLPPPDTFRFPFEPYSVQRDFMTQLWRTIEDGHLGIFESPTGTGKSMSMICGAMAWLRAHELREAESGAGAAVPCGVTMEVDGAADEPAWVMEHAVKAKVAAAERARQEAAEKREKYARLRQQSLHLEHKHKRPSKRLRLDPNPDSKGGPAQGGAAGTDAGEPADGDGEDIGDEFLLADYCSDDADAQSSSSEDEAEEEKPKTTKILFCSRTHSQLSQFMSELKNSPYGDARAVVLGSRQTLCVNDKVKKLSSISQINDKCKDLQEKKAADSGEKEGAGCPYLHTKRVRAFAQQTLAVVQDVEELASRGVRTKTCPYYGTREAIAEAEIVAMPYNLLLHKSTRDAVGLELEGNVVLIDEAHNLLSSIEAIHSNAVSGSLLERAHAQLHTYHAKYKSRLHPKNLRYVQQILEVLKAFVAYAQSLLSDRKRGTKVVTVNDFLRECKIDNVNIFKLARYFDVSGISKKVNGLVLKLDEAGSMSPRKGTAPAAAAPAVSAAADEDYVAKHVSALKMTETFFSLLTNREKDGRLVLQGGKSMSDVSIKFLLLNPGVYFEDVLLKARAVILAGGTMSPTRQFTDELCMVGTPPCDVFSCGHVIPPSNLAAAILCKGPIGKVNLEFSYENREDPKIGPQLLNEVTRLIINLCNVVPDGLVVFFPSYKYEAEVYNHWAKQEGMLDKVQQKKKLFREPRSGGPPVETVLRDYAKHIEENRGGALLLSVVGGKMSEGINFKDRLGRCVVVVGVPFPNLYSAELQEKMAFIDKRAGPGGSGGGKPKPSDEYYTSIAMKAVNQSIGRAIRHQKDFSTIVLADARYNKETIRPLLSQWIQASVESYSQFGAVIKKWGGFFKGHQSAATL